MDREELLKRIADARRDLEQAIGRFAPGQLTEPLLPNAWSVKDVLGHIGFWEARMVSLYSILHAGNIPDDVISEESVDELNEHVHQENQWLPLGIVQLNEKDAYQAILSIAESAPEADLFDPNRFAWTEGDPFYRFIAVNTYEHYKDHIPDLRAARPT
jgi:hypothetical protein